MGNELTIGETCYVTDGAHAKVKRQESGILYLTSKNITNGELKLDKVDWISEVDFNKLFSNTTKSQRLLQTGDVLMGIIGTLGNAYLYKSDDKFGISSSVAILRADPTKLMPEFLYYIVTSEKFKRTVEAYKGGSVQGYTNIATLKSLPIPNVTLNEQKKAVTILSSLDKKIQLNKKTNHTLEQMAQALFKSWFVDFDPVFDNLLASVDFKLENLENRLPDELQQKAQRRLAALNSLHNAAEIKTSLSALAHELQAQLPTKEATQAAVKISEKAAETPVKANFNTNPNILAQHANTHAHFPNEFEHNEQLGFIPKGWVVSELGGFINFSNGKAIKASEEGLYPIYGANGIIGRTSEVKFNNAIIIGRVGAYCGAVEYCRYKFWSSDNTIVASSKISEHNNPYVLHLLKYFNLNQYAGGAAQPLLNQTTLNKLITSVPSDKCLINFNKVVDDILIKKVKNNSQIATLTSLRDTLLPKLISGEVQV